MTDSRFRSASPDGDPWLLTPGPLTTSSSVKQAMLHDLGSRDARFIAVNAGVRERLLGVIGGQGYVCVPVQGSGTFAVEAMLGTLVPREGRVLILVNGAYGQRMARICGIIGRDFEVMEWPEDHPVDVDAVERRLEAGPGISHVAAVHCETTSGLLNPIEAIARAAARQGRRLLIDSMSAFGALPLNAGEVPFDAVVASSNKCLEGVPGLGFCLVKQATLEAAAGNAHSLTLDLHDQWQAMEKTKQWRFTPPTHAILAFAQALDEFEAEGGQPGRGARYAANCRILVEGMRALGFQTLLPDSLQAPIIVTFKMPADPAFDFQRFYDRMSEQGFVIYPGKLTVAPSFRIGCIGRLGAEEMRAAVKAVKATLEEIGIASGAPAAEAA
jgi:2-aminoethylphosphonate-pyruvate transaminase